MTRRLAPLLVAGIALVASCSGDDDAADSTVETPPTASTASTGTTSASATSAPVPTDGTAPTSAPPDTAPTTTTAATIDPDIDPAVTLNELTALESPVDLAWRDGDPGLYLVEQDGRVTWVPGDGTEPSDRTVLDITDLTSADGERGLLGLAFAPAGDLAYVNYTNADGHTVVAEYPVAVDGTFDVAAARVVIQIEQPYGNHNGGDLTFGPDGLLYIGMGDGGDAGDPERRGTDLSTLLGKVLRIDPAPSGDLGYTVPSDNPFVDQDGARPEIWASGLRNPWRFSFDRETGDLWIADVGQGEQEEVDVAPATDGVDAGKGLSFGWSAFEGTARYNDDVDDAGHTPPIHTYSHDDGGCSVSGGVRSRGGPVAALEGWYVFGDFCAGTIWALQVTGEGSSLTAGRLVELGSVEQLTAVVDGPAGELYALSQGGAVMRLDDA